MFDSVTHKTETIVTPVTRVVEKTITPDKVFDMYKEVRDEVEKNLIQVVRIESNILNGVVSEIVDRYDTSTHKIYTRFILNGEEYIDKTFETDITSMTSTQILEKLSSHYNSVIEKKLIKNIIPKFTKTGLRINNQQNL